MPFELGPESQIKCDVLIFRGEHTERQRQTERYKRIYSNILQNVIHGNFWELGL